ncbi:MAG: cytidylate kinase-like family protein [Armatimonadetes bacterium]|nr:cytidylate kinase-like family protein [Candidatus Hippobium faecium]
MSELQRYIGKFKGENAEPIIFRPSDLEIITISRTTGCGARKIAEKLSSILGYTVWDSEIMESICKNMSLSETQYHLLDESRFANAKDFVGGFMGVKGLNNFTYKQELTRLLYTICLNNKAIIIGRGANFFIKDALHIRLDADINKRIPKIAEDLSSSRIVAKDYIEKTDRKRMNFLNSCFGKDKVRSFRYDLMIDTDNFSYDDVCLIIKTAMDAHIKNLKKQYID